jgi:hypothetical protein
MQELQYVWLKGDESNSIKCLKRDFMRKFSTPPFLKMTENSSGTNGNTSRYFTDNQKFVST